MASRSRTIAKSIPAWEDYLAWATAKTDGSWLFRGHGQKRWLLTPKIGRPDIAGPKGWNEPDEKALIDDFWRLARRYIDPLVEPLEVLALGQHYGLPPSLHARGMRQLLRKRRIRAGLISSRFSQRRPLDACERC